MRKAILLCVLGLAAGFAISFLGCAKNGSAVLEPASAGPVSSSAIKNQTTVGTPEAPASPNLSLNTSKVKFACDVLEAIKARDYPALAHMIHPEKGVVFTPYSSVDLTANLKFTRTQIGALAGNSQTYVWGVYDGAGNPIKMTMSEYFEKFVFNTDYTAAPVIGVNKIIQSGNSLENVQKVFPTAQFVEFHYPSLDPEKEGMDWCSLKVVFESYQNTYKVVALIHSQWTI
ncbi:MAG: hypothetical protein PHT34_01015 [Oscillospiraceae bacterium]|mgnify:CR=1 FL=1|nr:hypothetical protein [Oscillospiraceae bacterium]